MALERETGGQWQPLRARKVRRYTSARNRSKPASNRITGNRIVQWLRRSAEPDPARTLDRVQRPNQSRSLPATTSKNRRVWSPSSLRKSTWKCHGTLAPAAVGCWAAGVWL